MKKFIIIIFVTLLSFTNGMAEDVLFEAKAPKQVISGRPFQLAYTVNAKGRNFEAPQFVDFEHMAGPYTSSSSSTTFVNGKRTSSFQMTYTYTLKANKEGTFTIGPASIIVSGEEYISNGVRITVLPPDQEESTHTQQSQQTSSQQSRQQNKQVNNTAEQDIFIRTIVSKTRVHEQEALLLTYRLYFHNVDVAQFTNNTKLPDFTGFLKQDIEQQDIKDKKRSCLHQLIELFNNDDKYLKGIRIHEDKLPVEDEFKEISKALNLDYLDLFFHVGEDFELLFTIPKSLEDTLKEKMEFYAIGEIIEENTVEIVLSNGKTKEISPKGYEHLS